MRLHRIATLLLALSLPAHAAILHVSPDGTAADGLSWQTAFPTISQAIVASTTGDEVWIKSGTYEENLVVMKSLKILGGFAGSESLAERELRSPITN
ncbi:MAG: hypothetical protein KC944_05045, partial [Candidatus Omnitrophica bacterium]|nr:hypothetical protein [Candidatus Omnitrophota bacterium]